MTHTIHLQGVPRMYTSALRRAVRQTLALCDAAPGSLTLRLADAAELRSLNAEFAHADHTTDVLSFPSNTPDSEGIGGYLGDIAIALPVAESNAKVAGHDTLSELILLAIHGTLHLLGYDHADPQTRAAMWQQQDRILADLGCSIRSPQD
jgi:probable rRNA maturation factor